MNLFKLPDGNLQALVKNRPFLSGEVFVQTVAVADATKYTGADQQQTPETICKGFYDAVTGAPIKKFFAGDLYGGTGDWAKNQATGIGRNNAEGIRIYQLGSGNALKFATENALIQYWTDGAKETVKDHPNTLYLYVGDPQVDTGSSITDAAFDWNTTGATEANIPGYEAAVDTEIAHQHFGDAGRKVKSNQLSDELNTGDIVFYSPVYDMFMIWHLSRTTSNLVRMLTANLTSKSLIKELGEGTVTLSDYVNRIGREFQRLDNTQGWVKLTASTTVDCNDITFGVPSDVEDKDGMIYYVPFSVGEGDDKLNLNFASSSSYKFSSDAEALEVWPGDVVITLPVHDETVTAAAKVGNSEGAGVKHVVVSLYGDYFKNNDLSTLEITRADDYADQRNLAGDTELEKALAAGTRGIKQVLENIYSTKVDIDPATHKIVTSQLPSFVLGGMKYSGNIDLEDFTGYSTAKDVVYALIANAYANKIGAWLSEEQRETILTGDIDNNGDVTDVQVGEDSDGNPVYSDLKTIITELNEETEAAVGSYFIWNGGHVSITDDGTTEATKEVTTSENTYDFKCLGSSEDNAIYSSTAVDAVSNRAKDFASAKIVWYSGRSAFDGWTYDDFVNSEDGVLIATVENGTVTYTGEQDDVLAEYSDVTTEGAVAIYGTIETTETVVVSKSTPMNVFFSDTAKEGSDDAQSQADHTSAELNNGDFLIFNGSTFDTIDNTSSISALSFKDEEHTTLKLLTGTPLLTHDKRESDVQGYSKGKLVKLRPDTGYREYEVDITQSGDDLTFGAKNSVMFDSGNLDVTHLPVIDVDGIAVNSPIILAKDATDEVYTKLKIDTDKTTTVFDFAKSLYALSQGVANSGLDLVSSYLADTVSYSPIYNKTLDTKSWEPAFERADDGQPEVALPSYSGVLTTEKYVQNAVKTLFDIIEAEIDNQTTGTEDWIQTIVEYDDPSSETGAKTKKIYDSFLKQVIEEKSSSTLEILIGAKGTNKTDAPAIAKLSAVNDLSTTDSTGGDTTTTPDWQTKIVEDANGKITFGEGADPRKASDMKDKDGKLPEVRLPNHGGTLLSTDSIIDCGTWL